MKRIVTFSLIVLLFAMCKKKEQPTASTTPVSSGHGVFVVNQGNYSHGDASVSYINLDSMLIHNNIYSNANGGIPLGDVAQSITIDGSNAYVVVNNSQRIECVNASTFKVISSINAPPSPRYLLKVGANKAYITQIPSASNHEVSILNTQTNSITGSINVNAWTEKMVQVGNEVYVTSPGGYNVYVINSQTDALTDSISLGFAPTSICTDKNGMIWVYCVGQSYGTLINPSLYEINPQNKTTVQTFNFTSVLASEGSMCMNANKDSLFFIHGDVYRMSISDAGIPSSGFISSGGGSKDFYGLLKVPDGRILVCDAQNFTQNGIVYVYSADGNLVKGFGVAADGPSEMVYY